jgi:hypothetical protein
MRGLHLDTRIGGHPVWRVCDERELMQVPEPLLKSVCFIRGYRPGGDRIGTAFLVGVPFVEGELDGDHFVYVVTARHNIKPVDKKGAFKKIKLWLNTTDGRSEEVDVSELPWRYYNDADVAVLWFAPPQKTFDYVPWAKAEPATKEFLHTHYQGVGAEVLIAGLLTNIPGRPQLQPIVRVGNIAGFPASPVLLATGREEAILVEVRSMGGLSGSPVFVHFPETLRDEEGNLRQLEAADGKWGPGGANYLMGVMHGFIKTSSKSPDQIHASASHPLNAGITAVVPIQKAYDLIDAKDWNVRRDEIREQREREQQGIEPAAGEPASESEYERFEDLARKLVNTPKSEIDEKRKSES